MLTSGPIAQAVEAGGSKVLGQPALYKKILSQRQNQEQKKVFIMKPVILYIYFVHADKKSRCVKFFPSK